MKRHSITINVLVRVDLLERTETAWVLTEVKASTSVKPYHLNDAAIQTWVLQGCGLKVDAVRLMHVNCRRDSAPKRTALAALLS
ncbi:MAG: hypothetical protein Q9M82_04980 [Mariprofundus sp.]|nr:hypothetical protein [Mariprofundus sp.]